jgi:hypothetical protein
MIYARVINGQIYDQATIQDLFPNTSFPHAGPTPEFLASENLVPIQERKQYDAQTQVLERVPAYIEDDVVYVVQARAKTSEELQAEQLALAAQNERQAKQLLASTDWTQLADVMLVNKQEFATYRAQLRQIATNPQAVVTWPAPPTNVWQ